MTGLSIAQEVDAALGEVAREVGDGAGFTVILRQISGRASSPFEVNFDQYQDTEINALISEFKARSIDGTLILRGDKRFLIAAVGPVPTVADTIIHASKAYSIINVLTLQPSGVPIYYEVQGRS